MTNYDPDTANPNKISLQEKVVSLVDGAGLAACDKVLKDHGIEMVLHRVQSTMVSILMGETVPAGQHSYVSADLRVIMALDLALESCL